MDFSALPTFVITLREGVEAALVVGIVLACLNKAQQSRLNSWVYSGVVAGIIASTLVGMLIGGVIQGLGTSQAQYAPIIKQLLETGFGIVAIALLSWMLIWMTQQARSMKSEVEGAIGAALKQDDRAGWGVFSLIFIAVLREGFETVIFIAAQLQQGLMPVIGALAGLFGAAAIGVLLFKWGVKINLRQFFQIMGVLLLLVVSGLVISALKHLDASVGLLSQVNRQFADLCFSQPSSCILGAQVWDASQVLPDNRFPGILLKSLFGYRQKLYLVQAVAYIGFLVTVGSLYFRSLGGVSSSRINRAATQTPVSSPQE